MPEDIIRNIFGLGDKIAHFRKMKKFSQDVLGSMIGKTRSSIAAYENNLVEPPISVLIELSKIFGITVYDFVHDIDAKEGTLNAAEQIYLEELKKQVEDLKIELGIIKKELTDCHKIIEDKNKIIQLFENSKEDMELKHRQLEEIYNKISKHLPS